MSQIRHVRIHIAGLIAFVKKGSGVRALFVKTRHGGGRHDPFLRVLGSEGANWQVEQELVDVDIRFGWSPKWPQATRLAMERGSRLKPARSSQSRGFDWLLDMSEVLGDKASLRQVLLEDELEGDDLAMVKHALVARVKLGGGDISCCRLCEWGPRMRDLRPVVLRAQNGFSAAGASAIILERSNPNPPDLGSAFVIEMRPFGSSDWQKLRPFVQPTTDETLDIFVTNLARDDNPGQTAVHFHHYYTLLDRPPAEPQELRRDPDNDFDTMLQPDCPGLRAIKDRNLKRLYKVYQPPICPGVEIDG